MSHKSHRSGGKISGNHTTLIPTAGILVDIAVLDEEVTKVHLGHISPKLSPIHGLVRVKFKFDLGSLLLLVRCNTSAQEIRIYTNDVLKTQHNLARSARDNKIGISFK